MKKRQIVNIVNFIRETEPRSPINLLETVQEEINLMKQYNLRGTFMLEYDALLDPVYVDLMKSLDPQQFELGVWFEVVQPLVEKVGLTWRGRYSWDWHVHCGFSMGYTKPQRELLLDELYEKFREIFGYYPRVFGSWFFDTHTARYVSDKYGVDAFCNCKEQYGTDGYTLWGGYYGQGYYPSRTNVFLPAQTEEQQIPVPLFRMLGSDHVYQYDLGLDPDSGAKPIQNVITLEPSYNEGGGGGHPGWVDWYMKENFNGECLSFGYAQAGQENSFPWSGIKGGLRYQFPLFAKLQEEGKLSVEPLGETGRWYKQTYTTTPASTITAHSAFDDPNKDSVWYCSKYYRANLYSDQGKLRIRDLHIFKEDYPDPFEDKVCPNNEATYDALPVVDGNVFSGNKIIAGAYPVDAKTGEAILSTDMCFTQTGENTALVDYGSIRFTLMEQGMKITADEDFIMDFRYGKTDHFFPVLVSCNDKVLRLRHNGMDYGIELTAGRFDGATKVCSEDGCIELNFI
jgi:hypothetical protein